MSDHATKLVTLEDGAYSPDQLRAWDEARLDDYARLKERVAKLEALVSALRARVEARR